MGTLTGNTPTLDEHCPHKLPTSCRLTASPTCCACQDQRPHASSYATYVDGVGLVNRGTRWQRYCFFCKEFWENRLAATNPRMQASQSRVPDIPDQALFLAAWFEYYRGYKITQGDDGMAEEIQVCREKSWTDTDPGTLPVKDEDENRLVLPAPSLEPSVREEVSLDDTLDNLLAEADEAENGPIPEPTHRNSRGAAEEHGRSQQHIDSEAMQDALDRLRDADAICASAEARRQRAAAELEAAENELRDAHVQRRQAVREHRGTQRLFRVLASQEDISQRTAQRYARIFGSREDIERQGANYVSPITSMFSRAWERFRVAEEVRAEERTATQNSERHREMLADLAQRQYPALYNAVQQQVDRELAAVDSTKSLDDDTQKDRPPPKSSEELWVNINCLVCLQQRAEIALLPCGHFILCSFCADLCIPSRSEDQSQPARKSVCPSCRRNVRRRIHIITP